MSEHPEPAAFFAHPLAICEAGASVGAGTKIWRHAHVMAGAVLGPDCLVGAGAAVASGARLGRGVRLQSGVQVVGGVDLGDYVFCGPGVVFTNIARPRAFVDQRAAYRLTTVEVGASLGANATILPGVRIGAFALIGAGAVVTQDVRPFAECVGNPARQHGWVARSGAKLTFDEDGDAQCEQTGDRYRLEAGCVHLLSAGEHSVPVNWRASPSLGSRSSR